MPSLEEMLQTLKTSFQGRLAPPLGGFVYRFTIFLPLLSEGQVVFSAAQVRLLTALFHACAAGFTQTSAEGGPPFHGSWLPPGATEPFVDRHTVMILYTPQIEEA